MSALALKSQKVSNIVQTCAFRAPTLALGHLMSACYLGATVQALQFQLCRRLASRAYEIVKNICKNEGPFQFY